jgi:hypothetical protein
MNEKPTLELRSDIRQLLVDTLQFSFLALAVSDVGDEDGQATHSIAFNSRHVASTDLKKKELIEFIPKAKHL